MEFLVRMSVHWPLERELAEELRRAEGARARELADEGVIVRLWRIPGTTANWGLWRAPDATELHAALMSLPLAAHAEFEVQALAEHPNDPAARQQTPAPPPPS
ncbi:muconolactone Delta-isomerase [Herbiconiux sp. A18JL235]|uniref:Muconolactone Delta-isomerase n=1 Tax=Herbiconiux sp. A18JL235 TaxID=3152363 RepID=A0AB39BDG8_9MICO